MNIFAELAATQGRISEGRAARAAGLPITRCPPYYTPLHQDEWRRGWRIENNLMPREAMAETHA